MSLRNTTDGGPAYVHSGNGEPHGPRVKRPGWAGWWLYAPDGTLVPDGHVEPVDPNARRDRTPTLPACGKPGHLARDRRRNKDGHLYCKACQRLAQAASVRARQARKAA